MSGPPVSRRAAMRSAGVAAAVGALALGGCDLDLSSSSEPVATPTPDPDESLLRSARAELVTLIAGVSTAGGDPLVTGLERVHRTQLAALGGTAPATAARVPAWGRRRVVAHERVAVARFTAWAGQAASGDLARVLAAVAAGIRMQPVLAGPA